MLKRISKSIWPGTLLIACLMGIWPGVGMGQDHWVFFGVIFGWLSFPMAFIARYQHSASSIPVSGPQLLAAGGYPLAVVGYSVCAYWTIIRTGLIRKGLMVALVAAGISALVSGLPPMIVWSISRGVNLLSFTLGYLASTMPILGIILFHLLISAVLGWLIGVGMARLRGRGALAGRAKDVSRETPSALAFEEGA